MTATTARSTHFPFNPDRPLTPDRDAQRASALIDELWLARARHLAIVSRGAGVLVADGGVRISEAGARSASNAVREAVLAGGRRAKAATLYLAIAGAELDRGEQHAVAEASPSRVVITSSESASRSLDSLARRLRALGLEIEVIVTK